jgi:GNAT superfamily N-acetyltransferase
MGAQTRFMKLPPGYRLRPGTKADGPALQELIFDILQTYGLRPEPAGTDADLLDVQTNYTASGGWFEVLLDPQGNIIGSVGLAVVRPGVVELRKMYLHAAHRGCGLGSLLLERALSEARRLGIVRVTLETAHALREAIRLYERAGFRRTPFAPHVCRCDFVMELELPFERTRDDGFSITTDPTKLDLAAIHAALSRTYWAENIPLETLSRALTHSLNFGLFHGSEQIGLARVITDRATYAYLCDVYVLETFRRRGLGKWLIETTLAHPELRNLRRFQLVTRDMHPLYAPFGFQPSANPERHMEISRRNVYA